MRHIVPRGTVLAALLVTTAAHASETIHYSYDAKGRLIQVQHTGAVNDNLVTTYTFDAADNRTNVSVTGATQRAVVVPLAGYTLIPVR